MLGSPTQIACFSVANEVVTPNSIATLRYFRQPAPAVQLSQGSSSFLDRYQPHLGLYHRRPLDNIFTAVLGPETKDVFRRADVVTWRGVIYKLMRGNKIQLNISFIDGTLYLEEHDTLPFSQTTLDSNTFVGLAFEAFCTKSSLDEDDSATSGVNLNPHDLWCSIVSRKLGDMNLVIAGKVDCAKGAYTGNPDCFVELKTRRINASRSEFNNQMTYQKWYMQCKVLGIDNIFLGHRTVDEVLEETEWIRVDDLAERVKRWDPQRDIEKGATILESLRAFCRARVRTREDEGKVWRVEVTGSDRPPPRRRPPRFSTIRRGVFIRELATDEKANLSCREERVGIVPARVVEQLRSK